MGVNLQHPWLIQGSSNKEIICGKFLESVKRVEYARHIEFPSVSHPMVRLRQLKQDCWVCPLSLDTEPRICP